MLKNKEIVNRDLRRVEDISRLLDSQFRIPGTNFRFGLDPILGLLPVAGDLSTFLISGSLVMTMARHGVSRKVVILMMMNVILDAIIGCIPIIGQIFDFTYKANDRNIKLLKKHYQEGKYQGTGNGIIITILLITLIILIVIGYLMFKLLQYFYNWVAGLF
jgi:heme/copper-type cytochrome/quinol oxidase subunit 3